MAGQGQLQTVLEAIPASSRALNSSGLLAAVDPRPPQPFCHDAEGWGPLSPHRFDFTPCFLDVWVILVAVFGLALGAGALWVLLKRRTPQPVQKNWHFYAKLV
jgi:hypothetical protein